MNRTSQHTLSSSGKARPYDRNLYLVSKPAHPESELLKMVGIFNILCGIIIFLFSLALL